MRILKELLSGTVLFTMAVLIINIPVFAGEKRQSFDFSEGKVSTAVITAGPFDLHRRYRSMEGPYISFNFKPGDVVASKDVSLPEGMVTFVEGGAGPAMMGGAASTTMTKVQGMADTSTEPRRLMWLKGIKEEVLDENGKPLPTAEFICHWNLDVNPNYRNTIFPSAAKCATTRLCTITQGQTEVTFPDGFGVPVATDEPWNCVFQAANRTTDDHVRVKHRVTFYFIKDSDLVYPITALNWYAPWIYVVIDKDSPTAAVAEKANCPSCLGLTVGVNAPNNTSNGTFTDSKGRLMSGHWVIPPGTHSYTATINDEMEPGFNEKTRVLHAVWSHIHPLCSELTLYKCEGDARKKMFSTNAKTDTKRGLQIENISYLSSKKGIELPGKANYELEVTYKNTTKTPQDSMATAGMFFEDPTFSRPDWVLHAKEGYACSMTKACTADAAHATTSDAINNTHGTSAETISIASTNNAANPAVPDSILQTPLFDKNQDGPLLTESKTVTVQTNAGPLTLRLDPSIAPITATQMYRLFSSGTFNGTRVYHLDPGYLLQIASVEDKASGQSPITPQSKTIVRRLPLEVGQQPAGKLTHQKYVLSMARYPNQADTGISSFFILLKDSPHLDHQFAVFGRLEENPATLATLDKIEKNWDADKYWITGCKPVNNLVSNNN